MILFYIAWFLFTRQSSGDKKKFLEISNVHEWNTVEVWSQLLFRPVHCHFNFLHPHNQSNFKVVHDYLKKKKKLVAFTPICHNIGQTIPCHFDYVESNWNMKMVSKLHRHSLSSREMRDQNSPCDHTIGGSKGPGVQLPIQRSKIYHELSKKYYNISSIRIIREYWIVRFELLHIVWSKAKNKRTVATKYCCYFKQLPKNVWIFGFDDHFFALQLLKFSRRN